jgi:hypothetical protein
MNKTQERFYMSSKLKPDSMFKVFIEAFADDFGIVNPQLMQTQRREILPEFVQMDAVVAFPDDFDFTTLRDRTFPFLGKYDALEYKGANDPLSVMRCYQYSLTELGILTTFFLSKVRKDRKERESLTLIRAREQWLKLKQAGATHSCCVVILSTGDPRQLRKEAGFEPVSDYPHLDGALHRLVVFENQFVGSLAIYLVVLNKLAVHAKNASLLLLSKGKKQAEFCDWLAQEHSGLTLQQRQDLIYYLFKYQLIENKEIEKEMRRKLLFSPDDYEWFLDLFDDGTEEHKARFLQQTFKRMLDADNPLQVAQKVLHANSPVELAQKALHANSPVELALKAIQSEEERRELIARLQQTSYQTVNTTRLQAPASA